MTLHNHQAIRRVAATRGSAGGNNWLTDAHSWLAMDATPMLNTTDPAWAFNGNFYWGTFSPIQQSWITYKRRYLSLQDESRVYGSSWALNTRFQSATLQDSSSSLYRPWIHRGDSDTTNGAWDITFQAEGSAGSNTVTQIRQRESGSLSIVTLPWGYPGSESTFHNVTIASGDGSTILYVDGSKRFTYGFDTEISTSSLPTYLGLNIGVTNTSFTIDGNRHFSWLNYKPSDDEVINTIHPAMSGFNP